MAQLRAGPPEQQVCRQAARQAHHQVGVQVAHVAGAAPAMPARVVGRRHEVAHGAGKLGLRCGAAPAALAALALAGRTGRGLASCTGGCRRCAAAALALSGSPAAEAAKQAAEEAAAAPATLRRGGCLLRLGRRLGRLQLTEAALQARLGVHGRCRTPVLLLLHVVSRKHITVRHSCKSQASAGHPPADA